MTNNVLAFFIICTAPSTVTNDVLAFFIICTAPSTVTNNVLAFFIICTAPSTVTNDVLALFIICTNNNVGKWLHRPPAHQPLGEDDHGDGNDNDCQFVQRCKWFWQQQKNTICCIIIDRTTTGSMQKKTLTHTLHLISKSFEEEHGNVVSLHTCSRHLTKKVSISCVSVARPAHVICY